MWGVSQLSAHYTGISVVPEVITDGAPSAVDTYLYSSTSNAREPNFFIGAGHYQQST